MKHEHHSTILTLVSMLANVSEERERLECELKNLRLDYSDSQDTILNLKNDLVSLHGSYDKLQEKYEDLVRQQKVVPLISAQDKQVAFLMSLFRTPEVWNKLRTYMEAEGKKNMRSNKKIAVVKEVRTITHCGLKQAKDFAESYTWDVEDIISSPLFPCEKCGAHEGEPCEPVCYNYHSQSHNEE
jgi:ribosomal protein L7/L12